MTTSTEFELECQALGLACAKAKSRLDEKAPQAFKSAFVGYKGPKKFPSYFERKWLSLRLSAVKRGMVVDPLVTPDFLIRITDGHCPVTLEVFDFNGASSRNPTVDRLVNDVTYLTGNMCMLSMRANRAKAEKTFEEVVEMAQQGQVRDGLEPVEWMRLASLMYGAWNRAGQRGDPYLLPLAAMHGPGMFTTTSQVVQHLLMRHCRSDTWPESLNVWLDITRRSSSSEAVFMAFATALKLEMQEQSPSCNAWLRSDVFEDFVEWYNACHQAIKAQVEPLLLEYQQRAHADANSSQWLNASRYQQ